MSTAPRRAVVLSAGLGTRLGALTESTPKPMLDVAGAPIIEHILRSLAGPGFVDVALNLHFRGDLIAQHIGDGARLGLRVQYAREPVLRGTAGGIHGLAALFRPPAGPVLAHYGDIITNHDLAQLWRDHHARGAAATLLVHRRVGSNSVVTLEGDRVVAFVERPAQRLETELWVVSGIAVLSPVAIARGAIGGTPDLPRDVLMPMVAAGAAVFASPLRGQRVAIDSPARLEVARAAVAEGMFTEGIKGSGTGC
jgi:NDP-sugar pyrophosphorylase family protein